MAMWTEEGVVDGEGRGGVLVNDGSVGFEGVWRSL